MLQLLVLLIPIAAVIWKAWGYPGAGRLALITIIYLLVLLRGAPINNVFPYLLLLPLILGIGAMVVSKTIDMDAKGVQHLT